MPLKSAKPETVTIRQPFRGVEPFCLYCRAMRIAPWIPASCPVCKRLMRIQADDIGELGSVLREHPDAT